MRGKYAASLSFSNMQTFASSLHTLDIKNWKTKNDFLDTNAWPMFPLIVECKISKKEEKKVSNWKQKQILFFIKQ